jgi:hypothetical protein
MAPLHVYHRTTRHQPCLEINVSDSAGKQRWVLENLQVCVPSIPKLLSTAVIGSQRNSLATKPIADEVSVAIDEIDTDIALIEKKLEVS